MISKKEMILSYMEDFTNNASNDFEGFTTQHISDHFGMLRANVSTILNGLVKDGVVEKTKTRPVMYRILQNKSLVSQTSCFDRLIGYDRSLKNCVKLAKAAILYPENSMNTLIIGEKGSGKSYLSYLMYQFAIEQQVIKEDAPYIKFNCEYYLNREDELISQLYGNADTSEKGVLEQASNGVLFIDHVDKLSPKAKRLLTDYVENEKPAQMILVCAVDERDDLEANNIFNHKFPIRIEIPSLAQRSKEERFELIEYFFRNEAEKMKKPIKINSELFRCFLLYYTQENVKQLKVDIKIGCANAYVREINSDAKELHVYINDCYPYVRKGFMFYKENRKEIEALIPDNYTYTFTKDESRIETSAYAKLQTQNTIYDVIEQKVEELRERNIKEEDILTILSADIESDLFNVKNKINDSPLDISLFTRIVSEDIIVFVDNLLKDASVTFKKAYPSSTFYGLCLHLHAFLKKDQYEQNLTNEKIVEIVDKYKPEYSFCMKYANQFERDFKIRLPIDEVVFMTIFLCEDKENETEASKAPLLVVMHGTIASAIKKTVASIYHSDYIYSYDLLLDKDMKEAYEELKNLCKVINTSRGLLIVYDMGSIRTMCESIVSELSINAKMIEVPITAMMLDCAIKLSTNISVEAVYNDMMSSSFGVFGSLKNLYEREEIEHKKLIITLCRTGEESAKQIQQYLEQNLLLEQIDVIPIAESDQRRLIKSFNQLLQDHQILCIVGTYDPKMFDIPFISIATLFDTPVDKLPMLLSLKETDLPQSFDYTVMYEYLSEQLPELDIKALKRCLPQAISAIKRSTPLFTINEEVGLFMHIACSIPRIKANRELPLNVYKDSIISKNKRLYHKLKDILEPVESEMGVLFNDDEIATIIEIIKQL